MNEPLPPSDAKAALLRILEEGTVTFSRHAREEMAEDQLNDQDALNVLRGGVVEPAEFENGSYRYRVRTSRMYFVVSFRSDDEVRVVTAWRVRR